MLPDELRAYPETHAFRASSVAPAGRICPTAATSPKAREMMAQISLDPFAPNLSGRWRSVAGPGGFPIGLGIQHLAKVLDLVQAHSRVVQHRQLGYSTERPADSLLCNHRLPASFEQGPRHPNCTVDAMTALGDVPTTVTVRSTTLKRLRASKALGLTLDDVLNDLMADTPPASFWREIERRRREPTVSAETVYRKLRL